MRFRRVVALAATVGMVGLAGAFGAAGVANAQDVAPVTPSSYGYIAGADGVVFETLTGGSNILSAASPVAPPFDPAAKVPDNSLATIPPFTVGGLTIGLGADGGAGALTVSTTADPTTGVSTAKVNGATATVGASVGAGTLFNTVGGLLPEPFKTALRTAAIVGDLVSLGVKVTLTGINPSCQAGPVGTQATVDGSALSGSIAISTAVGDVSLPFASSWITNGGINIPGVLTASTKVVNNLPDGGISLDAISVGVLGQNINLGHVECHPGTPVADVPVMSPAAAVGGVAALSTIAAVGAIVIYRRGRHIGSSGS